MAKLVATSCTRACAVMFVCYADLSFVSVNLSDSHSRVCSLSLSHSLTPSTGDRQIAAATPTTNAVCVTNTNCTVGLTTEASSGTTTSPATCQPRCTPCPSNQALQVSADGCGTCSTLASAAAGNFYNSLHRSSFCSQLSFFSSCFVVVCLCVCVFVCLFVCLPLTTITLACVG
jgi:hypothetical protein